MSFIRYLKIYIPQTTGAMAASFLMGELFNLALVFGVISVISFLLCVKEQVEVIQLADKYDVKV